MNAIVAERVDLDLIAWVVDEVGTQGTLVEVMDDHLARVARPAADLALAGECLGPDHVMTRTRAFPLSST